MAATAPPEESLPSGRSNPVQRGLPQPPAAYSQPPAAYSQQLATYSQQPGYSQPPATNFQQPGYSQPPYPVHSEGYPLQPYTSQFGPQRVFYEPMVAASLQTLHVEYPPHGSAARVAPPYLPPPPYPQYGATQPSPPQPTTPAPSRPPPQASPSNCQCCSKIIKTIIILAIISLIVSACYYFFILRKRH